MSLRVGVVGWGDAGRIHAKHLAEHGARLTGVVSRKEPGRAIPWFHSLEDLLPEVDALSITTPNDLHAGMVLAAVRAGKAVMVEKPLCITRDELTQLELVLPSAGVPVHLGYRLRFNDDVQRLRRRGSVYGVPSRVYCSYQLGIDRLASGKSWILDPDRSGGAFFVLGIHCHDLVRWLCRAQGRALTDLVVPDDLRDDFPLQVSLTGRLGETQLGISVDLRGSADYHLRVIAEWPDDRKAHTVTLSGEGPGLREEAEFSGLMGNFVRAAEEGMVDPVAVAEILQTHRELLDARARLESRPRRRAGAGL